MFYIENNVGAGIRCYLDLKYLINNIFWGAIYMKKILSFMMVLVVLIGVLAGCNSKANNKQKKETSVDLQGNYTVKDPEGLEYDSRTVIYKPNIAGDDVYEKGGKDSYVVIYSLEKKGKYMFNVQTFDTNENAVAYQKEQGNGTVDGKVVIVESDENFFIAMESFIPSPDDFINNMKQNGYMDLE